MFMIHSGPVGGQKPKMGQHSRSAALGRNSPKWALGRIFFCFCPKSGFFFNHQTLLPEGGTTAKWKPKFMIKQKSFLPEVGIF
jgi:hypothetical protein